MQFNGQHSVAQNKPTSFHVHQGGQEHDHWDKLCVVAAEAAQGIHATARNLLFLAACIDLEMRDPAFRRKVFVIAILRLACPRKISSGLEP
jgi:hypothetical protein